MLPAIDDPDARAAIQSLKGSVDVWVGAQDRMVRQERIILSVQVPAIEPNGDPVTATVDFTIAYSNLNQPVNIREPERNDTSPLMTPRPNVAPVVGPPGAPASSTAAVPGAGGPSTGPSQTTPPVQAPAQVPRR